MFKEDIVEYKEFIKELSEDSELNFANCVAMGDYEKAYNNLLIMMAYGIVTPSDPRCSKTYAGLGDKVHYGKFRKSSDSNTEMYGELISYGKYDYTTTDGRSRIRKFPYCDLKYSRGFKVRRIPHWLEYTEYGMDGALRCEETSYNMTINLVEYSGYVSRVVTSMCNIAKKHKIDMPADELTEALKIGAIRVYEISLHGESIPNNLKNFGYIIIRMDESGELQAIKLIDYDNVVTEWVDLGDLGKNVDEAIRKCVDSKDIKTDDLVKSEKYRELQSEKIKLDKTYKFEPKKE